VTIEIPPLALPSAVAAADFSTFRIQRMSATLEKPPQKRRSEALANGGASSETLDPRARKRLEEREKLRTSKFDTVSAFLMALLWFIGIFVLLLFLIWVTSRISFGPRPFPPIIETPAARGDNAEGTERDFDPPGADEIVELSEPTIQETLTAVTDAVSSVAAVPETGTTSGKGDSRPPGPEAEGDDIIPRHERWNLRFSAKNANAYAQQLDYYKIELGAIGGGPGVDYAFGLAGSPQTRHGKRDDEKRLYFMWVDRSSPLYQFDRQLLQKAGVNIGAGRETLKFIEPELENMLAHVELEHAAKNGHPSVTEIQKTIFESQAKGGGYEFVVVDQTYRKPRK
jgi:hypothetical protein